MAISLPFRDGHISASLSMTGSLPFLDASSVRVVFKGCSRPAVSQWIGFVRVVGGCSRPAGGCLRLSSTRTPRNRTVWSVASVGSRAPSRRLRRPSRRLCRPSRRLRRPSRHLRRLSRRASSESPSASSESPSVTSESPSVSSESPSASSESPSASSESPSVSSESPSSSEPP